MSKRTSSHGEAAEMQRRKAITRQATDKHLSMRSDPIILIYRSSHSSHRFLCVPFEEECVWFSMHDDDDEEKRQDKSLVRYMKQRQIDLINYLGRWTTEHGKAKEEKKAR